MNQPIESVDNLPRTEKRAQSIVFNYDQAQAWYPAGGQQSGRGLYDYVIITLDTLVPAVTPLVNFETSSMPALDSLFPLPEFKTLLFISVTAFLKLI